MIPPLFPAMIPSLAPTELLYINSSVLVPASLYLADGYLQPVVLHGTVALMFLLHVNLIIEQEAFEKCWAHSPLRAAARPFTHQVSLLTPPAHRCPRQRRRQRQRVTEGTAMAPWNGPNQYHNVV